MPIKAVVDTNIWVSAVLNAGAARQLVQLLAVDRFELCSSAQLMAELISVLHRPKVTTIVKEDDVEELLLIVQDKATTLDVEHVPAISRDPKDDVFLACAQAGRANYLVTGDNDLLCLKAHGATKIVTPAEFLEILSGEPGANLA